MCVLLGAVKKVLLARNGLVCKKGNRRYFMKNILNQVCLKCKFATKIGISTDNVGMLLLKFYWKCKYVVYLAKIIRVYVVVKLILAWQRDFSHTHQRDAAQNLPFRYTSC